MARYLLSQSKENSLGLRYPDHRLIHNLKCFIWVEQQGKTCEEIQKMWHNPDYWTGVQKQADEIDALIEKFNTEIGLI